MTIINKVMFMENINRKLEKMNLDLVNGVIALIGIICVIVGMSVIDTDITTILVSVGCSLLASSIVAFLSSRYLLRKNKIKDIIDKWGLEGIYRTRQEMNLSCNRNLNQLESELDIIAFGLKSFRNSQTDEMIKKVEKGLSIRILTINPNSPYLKQREKDEKEVAGQIKNTILELEKWVNVLKDKAMDSNNVQMKYYDTLPLDFYFREDDYIYIGPYQYGISSQQTISYEFRKDSEGYEYYLRYFEKLWSDNEFCKSSYLEFDINKNESLTISESIS